MNNLLPAVLVGGPPHAGKSVLVYALRQALLERGIAHYLLRACPDGEGNWFHEGDPETVVLLRFPLRGAWPAAFVQRISQDIEHRCLPFLVDMGGRPQSSDADLFRQCTHAILLLREDQPDETTLWQHLVDDYHLRPLARLFSRRAGLAEITALSPLLEGTLTGLERHTAHTGYGPVFNELVERVAALFHSFNLHDRKQLYFEHAPTALARDVESDLHTFTTSTRWEPQMLFPYLQSLPQQTPLSIYGIGPNWLYAALAAHAGQQPFYLFDPKLPFGWVQPAHVSLGEERSSEIQSKVHDNHDVTVLNITFPQDRLDYFQPGPLAFPSVPVEKGLILDGRLPHWLLTALTSLYQAVGVPWIAPFYPPLNSAIVAYSRVPTHHPGSLVARPMT